MNKFFQSLKSTVTSKRFKYGGYAVGMTVLAIALVVIFNVGLTSLAGKVDLKADLSQNKMFSLTPQTEKILKAVDKDIHIYTTYTPGAEDKDVQEILNKIKALNPHITLENHDPDRDPRFMQTFTKAGETIAAGSVIVSDAEGKLYKVLANTDLYAYTYDANYNATPTQNKTEGAVTQAVNYIVNGYIPMAYIVQGHGEATQASLSAVQQVLESDNYKVSTVNIATNPDTIKAGDVVMFFAPKSDLLDAERDTLKKLMDKGGRFYFLFDPTTIDVSKMPNFASLLDLFAIKLKQGMIFENDANYRYSQYAGVLVPKLQSHASTDSLISAGMPVVIPYAGALELPDVAPESTMTITSLLKTSAQSYLKANPDLTNQNYDYTKAEGDEEGPFDVAVAVDKKVDSDVNNNVRMVVVYNGSFVGDANYAYSTSNFNFLLNTSAWMRNADKDIYVRPKTLTNSSLVFHSQAEQTLVAIFSSALIPLLLLAAGIYVYLRRKHL